MPAFYMQRLSIDEREIESRRALFEIGEADLRRLAAARDKAERSAVEIVDALYELIARHPETRAFFPDEASLARIKGLQREYFLGLFAGRCDRRYVEDRLRVGAVHQQVGLAPKWYIGAYGRYLRLFLERLVGDPDDQEARALYDSLVKLVAFDMSLAFDTYLAEHRDSMLRHQEAIRELSRPIIRSCPRVLLLPLIVRSPLVSSRRGWGARGGGSMHADRRSSILSAALHPAGRSGSSGRRPHRGPRPAPRAARAGVARIAGRTPASPPTAAAAA